MSTTVTNSIESDIAAIRQQFPALSRSAEGKNFVYLDGPAGTQVPTCVIDAISHYLKHMNANHGGAFATSLESDDMLHSAHKAMAAFVGSSDPGEVHFGQNMTSLTFALSRSIAKTWNAGDEIIVTRLDHDANVTPWVLAAEDSDVNVKYVDFNLDVYTLDLDQMRTFLNERTRLVAIGAASNATGGVNPVKKITQMAHEAGAQVFVDAVHYGPHGLIDVADWQCDYLSCSTYKFFGPHLGAMWGRRDLLESLDPYKVRPSENTLPGRWMSGTQNHEAIAGGLECINYLCRLGNSEFDPSSEQWRPALESCYRSIHTYENGLTTHFLSRISKIDGVHVFGITDPNRLQERCSTFSITIDGMSSAEIAKRLAEEMIFVWNGNYYALQFTESLGLEPDGMVRIGLVHYNTLEEIDRLVDSLERMVAET